MILVIVVSVWLGIVVLAVLTDSLVDCFVDRNIKNPVKPAKDKKPRIPRFNLDEMLTRGVAQSRRIQRMNLGVCDMQMLQPRRHGAHRRMAA